MSARDQVVAMVRKALRSFDVRLVRDRPMRDPVRLISLKARELGCRTVLDVGANIGQFGEELLRTGWNGKLVSFEPIAANHAALEVCAARFPNWSVAPAMALGAVEARADINVSENMVSSSLLPVGRASTDVLDETRYTRSEPVMVRRLDDVIQPSWPAPFAIKTDTQGFELEVLRGAPNTLSNARVLMVEMSMAPLYEGGAQFASLYSFIENAGFRCIALTEGFADCARNEVLQVDGVFVRNGL